MRVSAPRCNVFLRGPLFASRKRQTERVTEQSWGFTRKKSGGRAAVFRVAAPPDPILTGNAAACYFLPEVRVQQPSIKNLVRIGTMNVYQRLVSVVIAASVLAWPAAAVGLSCCAPSPSCAMSCCRSSHGTGALPPGDSAAGKPCPAADTTITCDCGHGADSWSLSALPKTILGRTPVLTAPSYRRGDCPWRKSDELAGYLSVLSPPPLGLQSTNSPS